MKYYLIEVTNYNNGTSESKAMYNYDNYQEAEANYHSKLGGAMKNVTYESEMCMIIDSTGAIYLTKYWVRDHSNDKKEEG